MKARLYLIVLFFYKCFMLESRLFIYWIHAMFQIWTIALIALLAAMSPGPDFVVVTKNALSRSRFHGLSCTLGITLGLLCHTTYCVMGLALVIAKSILLFNLIKYLGATYLIYIGIKNLIAKKTSFALSQSGSDKHINKANHFQAFMEGFLANILNPKCTLFMLSLFTLVISPDTNQWIKIGYGLEIIIISLIWFCFLSISITLRPIQKKLNKMQLAISRISGVLLIALGIRVALEKGHY